MNKSYYQVILNALGFLLILCHAANSQNTANEFLFTTSRINNAGKTVQNAPASDKDSGETSVTEKLRSVLPQIKNRTAIPVLLPNKLPQFENEQSLLVDGRSNRDMYSITVSDVPDCNANACLIAVFSAERGAAAPDRETVDKVIPLAGGLEGFYTGKSCGASCTPPQIELIYENVLYTFQFKSADEVEGSDEANIIEIVNSAMDFIKQ